MEMDMEVGAGILHWGGLDFAPRRRKRVYTYTTATSSICGNLRVALAATRILIYLNLPKRVYSSLGLATFIGLHPSYIIWVYQS